MKHFYLLPLLLLMPYLTFGQNVGIGKSNPTQKLDVDGNIRLSGTNRQIGTWSADPVSIVTNSIERIRIQADGKVGIGTTNPLHILHVNGNIRMDGRMIEGNANYRVYRNLATYNSSTSGAAGAFVINTKQPWNSACMFSVELDGYFYDATAPFNITVAGYIYTNNTFYNTGYINTGSQKLSVRLGRNIADNTVAIILGSEGSAYSYPKLTVKSFMQGHSNIGEAYADGWTIQQHTSLAGYDFIVGVPDKTAAAPSAGSDHYIWNQNASAQSANFWISGNGFINGNAGIGTSSPAERLHVEGNLRLGGTASINTTGDHLKIMYGVRAANDNAYEWVGFYSGTTRQGIILYDGPWSGATNQGKEFSITAENNNMLTLNTQANQHIALMPKGSGNVGVGTISPSEKLHSTGNIRADGIAYWGNGLVRTETRDAAGLQGNAGARSGFFETSAPSPASQWYSGASGWQHFLDIRHSNNANNYAMQFAGGFFDQRLFFRKTADNPNQPWTQVHTTGTVAKLFSTYTFDNWGNNAVRMVTIPIAGLTQNSSASVSIVGPTVTSIDPWLTFRNVTCENGQLIIYILNSTGTTIYGSLPFAITVYY